MTRVAVDGGEVGVTVRGSEPIVLIPVGAMADELPVVGSAGSATASR